MLVTLTITQWSARKYDRKATDEVNKNHNATEAGRFNKLLIGKEHLDAIQKIVTEARNFHYDNSMPWGDLGERLLPSMNFFEYTQGLRDIKSKYENAVSNFLKEYPLLKQAAQARLNTLYNENDYPRDIESKFTFKTQFMPIPDTDDFRVNLSSEQVEILREEIAGEVTDRFAKAQRSVYERVIDQLKHMHERLSDSKNVFRDTLFENLRDLIDLIPRLNIAGDAMIESLCVDLKNILVDPDSVRKDEGLRRTKANEVSAILKNMDALFSAPKTNPVEV